MGSCAACQAAGGTSKGEQWVMQAVVVLVLVTNDWQSGPDCQSM